MKNPGAGRGAGRPPSAWMTWARAGRPRLVWLGVGRAATASLGVGLLVLPAAGAVDYSCTSSGSGQTCTIPAGSYTTKVQQGFWSTNTAYTVTNQGTFDVTIPVPDGGYNVVLTFESSGLNGTDSSDDDAGSGTSSGPLGFTNAGAITQTHSTGFINDRVPGIHAWTQGGDGGDYTNDNAKHNAGAPGNAGTMELVNNAEVLIWYPSLAGGVALLAESLGGAGGNVKSIGPDHNGNPQYHNQIGTGGGSGAAVTLTNNASVSTQGVEAVTGYWAVAARSIGGNGGTGNDGTPGGGAGAVTIQNAAAVSVDLDWMEAPATPPGDSPEGAYGLYGSSLGGNGNMSVNSGNDGGAGGNADAVTINLSDGGNVSVTTSGTASDTASGAGTGAAIAALSTGGNGGAGYDSSTGGKGGNPGAVSVTSDGADAAGSGDGIGGMLARAEGGSGGDGGIGQDHSNAGAGGSSGNHADTSPAVSLHLTDTELTTDGSAAAGIIAVSRGGTGGDGTDYEKALSQGTSGGHGGGGGNTGPVTLTLDGNSRVQTQGAQAPAVIALARGGNGGEGGDLAGGEGDAGDGGTGGQGAPVQVEVGGGISISTSGAPAGDGSNPAVGILAQSSGGTGGTGGELNVDEGGAGADGGYGGGGYAVSVTIDAGASVSTTGADAVGIVAQSLSGAGGDAGEIFQGGLGSSPGTGGASGDTGAVTVTHGGTLTTLGDSAMGILAQSMPGNGGGTQEVSGYGVNPGGSGGSSGTTGSAGVTHSGGISTQGQYAHGIAAQAIGGGGGAGGSTSGSIISSLGGDGGFGSNGGGVSLTNSGSVTTAGGYALGVLAQSIGGGGGDGGDASGVISSVGGSGNGGGNGGTVTLTQSAAGQVATSGQLAPALVAQSIGGGGGNAGDATASSDEGTLAIGGTGGAGGSGGSVSASLAGAVSTSASKSVGLLAQGIGGGGGSGGAAYAFSAGLDATAAVAVGGSGGVGGNGGTVAVTTNGATVSTGQFTIPNEPTNQLPVDAIGILAQSIGGGGGNGGAAFAEAIAIGLPDPEEGSVITASGTVSLGGDGNDGGAGEAVTVAVDDGTQVMTQGQGSHGILAQSIGSGGGNGGDSSSLSATIQYTRAADQLAASTYSFEGNFSNGGDGSAAGHGGDVTVDLVQDSGSAGVTTYGDHANAVVLQSIGAGGGNAGTGSSNSESFGNSAGAELDITTGSTGGKGGDGASATATVGGGASVTTYGDNANALVMQSIGGGGGTSQGGTLNLGGSFTFSGGDDSGETSDSGSADIDPEASLTLNLGATGGKGGDGGEVFLEHYGAIDTYGNDSIGVLMQSVGGGGGTAGSAGADASADNPVTPASALESVRAFATAYMEGYVPFSADATANVGSSADGSSGDGGAVTFFLQESSSIQTAGDWSQALVAQSVGGGGGDAGTATYSGSQAVMQLDLTVGATGDSVSGNGGDISLNFYKTSIQTSGYGAYGILAQSIGGGGGLGVDGSDAATGSITVGATGSTSGGGGQVTVNASTELNITTAGDTAHGMVLQSIGGSGGIGGAGNSVGDPADSAIDVVVGSTGTATNAGNTVFTDSPTVNIATAGDHAYGILAQSIGGGGGLANVRDPASVQVGTQNQSGSNPDGGQVFVNIDGDSSIQTSGDGAFAIVAQSIAGGGGIGGYSSGGSSISTSLSSAPTTLGKGNADEVQVYTGPEAQIGTEGDSAHGIIAQSIGSGGGIVPLDGGTAYFGSTNSSSSEGIGRPVTVTHQGDLEIEGDNAVGIFAQSTSGSGAGSTITIKIADGGSIYQASVFAPAPAVWVDGGDASNSFYADPSTSIFSYGTAVRQTGSGQISIDNEGVFAGDVQTENNFGVLGTMVNRGDFSIGRDSAVNLTNTGTLRIGDHLPNADFTQTTLKGDFTQTETGELHLDADFVGGRSDRLIVTGHADLAGELVPKISALVPGRELRFLQAGGGMSGSLAVDPVAELELFELEVRRDDGELILTTGSSDFSAGLPGLSPNQQAAAGYLDDLWMAGVSPDADGRFFLALQDSAAGGGYPQTLDALGPGATLGFAARALRQNQFYGNRVLNGPIFDGATVHLEEQTGAWARVYGRYAEVDVPGGFSDFDEALSIVQVGGQAEIAPDWYLGGSLAYQRAFIDSDNGVVDGDSDTAMAAVTLKHERDNWSLAAALVGTAGWGETKRRITLPGLVGAAEGEPALQTLGGVFRAAYTQGLDAWYLRPSLTLNIVYAHADDYTESGAGALSLAVDSAEQTTFIATPALEVGGRHDFANGTILRSYLNGGVSFASEDDWQQRARFATAPASAGDLTTTLPMDDVSGLVTAGLQLQVNENTSVFLQYEGELSEHVISNGGGAGVKVIF